MSSSKINYYNLKGLNASSLSSLQSQKEFKLEEVLFTEIPKITQGMRDKSWMSDEDYDRDQEKYGH